jgi:hypothetical protein
MTPAKLAIVCIFFLEGIALLQGIDGTALSASIAMIAGLGGYTIKVRGKKLIEAIKGVFF